MKNTTFEKEDATSIVANIDTNTDSYEENDEHYNSMLFLTNTTISGKRFQHIFKDTEEFVVFNIFKELEIPLNQIYNALKLNIYIKKLQVRMEKTVDGISITTQRNDIFALMTLYHSVRKNDVEKTSFKTENNILFEPIAVKEIQEKYQYSREIATDCFKTFQILRNYKNELSGLFEQYDGCCIFGETKVTLLCTKLSNQKVLYQKFTELYYRTYTIECDAFKTVITSHKLDSCKTILFCENGKFNICGQSNAIDEFIKYNQIDANSSFTTRFVVDAETSGFLSGKKYGKINKIIKNTETEIEIQNTDINFYQYSLFHTNINRMLDAINLLNLEYPCYHLFNIDYKHHKKIIGTSGKHIQRIMKKYDVYVKFMNEKEAQLYPENVICKTPQKNKNNLKLIQEEILLNENLYEEQKQGKFTLKTELPKIYELLNKMQ